MNPREWYNRDWHSSFDFTVKELKAGIDEHSHRRTKPRHSSREEPLCKACSQRKLRKKCRTVDCIRKGK